MHEPQDQGENPASMVSSNEVIPQACQSPIMDSLIVRRLNSSHTKNNLLADAYGPE